MSSSNMAEELRNFAADVDDRDEATREEIDMLRKAANMIEKLEQERDEARRIACEKQAKINQRLYDDKFYANPVVVMRDWGWDCYGSND